ncbi:helix-turn-helix transcriptional regulator [Micromonospora sp. STR1_7]|uniref:Helix-turn-helix transcriptional regulator n=1 Tax=Micromonospora parastrephiae TaxID=2806101 RepID=A0ABS1XWK9_9ACTN|nr:helix-turn-helix transcriptional regulator [Micromonospora parastrephiae]MBM0233648.1 helix-turn-helix transcriptional regulator [Micromonospora parastrephiae]
MLRLQLGPADLCRVRFADRLHPVGTALLAGQWLRDPTVVAMAPALAERAVAVEGTGVAQAATAVLRHLLPDRGRLPDFVTPFDGLESVAAGLEAIRATPARRVRAEVTEAYADTTVTPLRRRFAAADPEVLDLFGGAVRTWFDAVLAPHWPDLVSAYRQHVTCASQRLARYGLGGLFAGLHPAIRWREPVLEVQTWWSGDRTGTGHGVMLLPSPLAGPRPRVLVEPGHPILLVYPAPMPLVSAAHAGDSLGRLLGTTRALVLRRLADEGGLTTTALSRVVGVSLSSASEHATALRAAGLIASEREGGAVRHHLTPLGAQLLGGPGADSSAASPSAGQAAGWAPFLP